MNITREVILDLLPVYLAGEASPDTRTLVEEYVQHDAELAQSIRLQVAEAFATTPLPALPPELELRSLHRTRRLLGWQRWLFACAITFTALSLSSQFSFAGGRLREFHFLLRDYPAQYGICLMLAVISWLAYFSLRRRLRINRQ